MAYAAKAVMMPKKALERTRLRCAAPLSFNVEIMKYQCGTDVMLGDEIMVGHGPNQKARARVVVIGADQATPDIDPSFYSFAKDESIITPETVVVEWIELNPLAHHDPKYAPVRNYMTLQSLCRDIFIRRGREYQRSQQPSASDSSQSADGLTGRDS